MTHRGCKGNCIFCSEKGPVNEKNIKKIIQEIEFLTNDDEIRAEAIFFDDSTFFDYSHINELMEYLKTKNIEWGCLNRFDKIIGNKDIIKKVRDAGCTYMYFGLEQLDDNALRTMGKNLSVNQIIEALGILKQNNIRVGISILFGHTGKIDLKNLEELKNIQEKWDSKTIRFVNKEVGAENIHVVSLSMMNYHLIHKKIGEKQNIKIDYSKKPIKNCKPWFCFEEGEWFHPLTIDDNYAISLIKQIDGYQNLMRSLVRRDVVEYTLGKKQELPFD